MRITRDQLKQLIQEMSGPSRSLFPEIIDSIQNIYWDIIQDRMTSGMNDYEAHDFARTIILDEVTGLLDQLGSEVL